MTFNQHAGAAAGICSGIAGLIAAAIPSEQQPASATEPPARTVAAAPQQRGFVSDRAAPDAQVTMDIAELEQQLGQPWTNLAQLERDLRDDTESLLERLGQVRQLPGNRRTEVMGDLLQEVILQQQDTLRYLTELRQNMMLRLETEAVYEDEQFGADEQIDDWTVYGGDDFDAQELEWESFPYGSPGNNDRIGEDEGWGDPYGDEDAVFGDEEDTYEGFPYSDFYTDDPDWYEDWD